MVLYELLQKNLVIEFGTSFILTCWYSYIC